MAKPFLGVDPGLANCGWALLTYEGGRFNWTDGGTIKTKASSKNSSRLTHLSHSLLRPAMEANSLVYEDPNGFNSKTAYKTVYGCIGCLHGLAAGVGLNIRTVTVTQVKMLAGSRVASKEQMKYAVMEHVPDIPDGLSDHVYDAAAVVIVSIKKGK